MMLTIQKEKEILKFGKNKVKELRGLLESKEVQSKYKINPDCLEWDEHKVNIDNFTMRHYEISADIISIPIKDNVKDLHKLKIAIEEISKENKCALYVNDAYEWDGEVDEGYSLRLCSPSMNRNLQVLRLMAYRESEKINSLFSKVNHAKDKSLVANIRSIKKLLNLGVDTMLDLSYKNENVIGRIKRMDDVDIELLCHAQPELITISTLQMKDHWVINSINGETPINWMWSNAEKQEQDEFLSSMPWENV